MPSAPDHLRAKFPDGPEDALAVVAERFTCHNGLFRPKVAGTVETPEERDALDYLFHEWDYASTTEPEPTPKTRIVATPASSSTGEGTMWIPPGDTHVDNETGRRIPLGEKR